MGRTLSTEYLIKIAKNIKYFLFSNRGNVSPYDTQELSWKIRTIERSKGVVADQWKGKIHRADTNRFLKYD